MKKALADANVVLMLADWTNDDPVIAETLFAYGSASIPFYLMIPGDSDKPAIQLPENFTSGEPILRALEIATQ